MMCNTEKSFEEFQKFRYRPERDEIMLISVIFFFSVTLAFCLLKYLLGKFKYSPPTEPIFAIFGIIIGRIGQYLPNEQRWSGMAYTNLSGWIIIVIPIMYYRVCYFTEFSRNSKILAQALLFGILGTLISSIIIGITLKIMEIKELTFEMSLMLGLSCVPVYPTGSKEFSGFGTTSSHVNNLLDGEALIGTVTAFFFLETLMRPLLDHSFPESFLHYTLHLAIGSLIGWISGMGICRLMVKFSDLPTIILVIFFVPLIVSVFVHFSGFNEDLAMIVQVLLISKNRTVLGKETAHFYGQFVSLTFTLITDITLVYIGMFIGQEFTTVQLLSSIPYIMCMYIVVICGRFFSFAVLSSISNKCEWGLSLPQLGLVIWCGVPSVINIVMLINIHRNYGFENDNFGIVMIRNLGGLVILGYIINTWITSPMLFCLGLIGDSLTKDVNMNMCFRWIEETRQRSILILKMERWLRDAHWAMIKNSTELVHPLWIIASNSERDKEIFRFAVCNNCDLEFFVPPTFKEYKEMTCESRRRVLKSKKNFYINQYHIGMLSEESYRTLIEAIEKGLESPNVEFDTNKLLNMIRKINWMEHNSHRLCNTYEYRFKMTYKGNMKRFRRFVMNLVVHPLFDQSINLMTVVNLMVDIYFLIAVMRNVRHGLFFTIYGSFLGVYLLEVILKLYFFSIHRIYDGFPRYFRSAWNSVDAVLLLMTILVMSNLCYSVCVYYKSVLVVATLSKLRIIRILRLFQNFRYCHSVLSFIPRLYGDVLATRVYETGKTFIKCEQELMAVIPGMVKDPNITADILARMDEDIILVAREIEQIQRDRPQVAVNIKTKQAIRTVLNVLNEEIDYMKIAGWVDEIEYKLLSKSVYERYQHLHTLRKVKWNSPKAFFGDILWLNKDESLKQYLYDNVQTRVFASQDLIIVNGEHAGGIYIVVSGLLKMEYDPDFHTLEQLELYGALPVMDLIKNCNFRESRRDFIVAGNTFGELSVLTRRPYACSITADSSCELLFICEEFIRNAMELDNDPISGMESRMWKSICRNLTLDILLDATPPDEVRQCLERSFVPKLNDFKAFERNEYIEDIVIIEGSVLDGQTHAYFIAPKHLPRSVQNVYLPGSDQFSLDTRIETKLVLITIPDVKPEFIMKREHEFNKTVSSTN